MLDPVIERHLAATAGERLADYVEFLRIPSVGGMPAHDADTRRCGEWVAARLRRAGLPHVELSETGGHPLVYAEWLGAAGAPTALVYAHYDVQPVDPLDLWVRPPFEPRVEDGRVYARGAEDDKGQLHMHVAAIEALLATRRALPLNLKIIFEGEEESTSPHLDAWLEASRARLGADAAVITDSAFFEGNLPAVGYALRGLVGVDIRVSGPTIDVHSGGYGGTIENPINAVARIIASFHDAGHRVAIAGFYDDVLPLSEAEREELARLPFDAAAYRERLGAPALVGEEGYSHLERRWARPTLDVNGVWGGFSGEGSKTIIPAFAAAKVTCRLVPEQDPRRIAELLQRHVAAVTPEGVKVEVTVTNLGRPAITPIDHPATREAFAALEETFGRRPVFIREGGSVPVAASFQSILGLPVVLLGFGQPDSQAHGPNEWMDLANYETGIRAIVRYWERLGARGTALRA